MFNASHLHVSPFVLAVAIAMPLDSSAQRVQPAAFTPVAATVSAPATARAKGIWKPTKTRKANAWRAAKVGSMVGAAALPIAIYLDAPCNRDDACLTPLFMGIGVPAGAIVGAVVGAGLGALWWEPPKKA